MSSSKKPKETADYFQTERPWCDDLYLDILHSRNLYKYSFFISITSVLCLSIAIICLLPLKQWTPIAIHHFQDGRVTVESASKRHVRLEKSEVESEIARYVLNRLSYDASSYQAQYELTALLSSPKVTSEYMREQSSQNKNSPIRLMGKSGFRRARILNIFFLSGAFSEGKKSGSNLAEVNFEISDFTHIGGTPSSKELTALIAWHHKGTPKKQSEIWQNWDGFVVDQFTVEERAK